MIVERYMVHEDSAGVHDDVPAGAATPEQLEQRVSRLEDSVASLQDTRPMEDRVVERVAERLGRNAAQGIRNSAGAIVEASRRLIPAAIGMVHAQAGDGAKDPPLRAGAAPWLVFEVYDEMRTMVAMFFDPRYRPYMTWRARLVPFRIRAERNSRTNSTAWTLSP